MASERSLRLTAHEASTNGKRAAEPRTTPSRARLLTVSAAAEVLAAHPNSVRRWADMGLLPSFRIGVRGDRRFRFEDISAFLNAI